MTFPIIEIFCPQCNEQMTLVNKPEMLDYNTTITLGFITQGYDKMVEYHYQCKSNERHEGKWHRLNSDMMKEVIYEGELNDDGEPIIITPKNCQEFSKCGKNDWCNISSEREILVMRMLIPKLDYLTTYETKEPIVKKQFNWGKLNDFLYKNAKIKDKGEKSFGQGHDALKIDKFYPPDSKPEASHTVKITNIRKAEPNIYKDDFPKEKPELFQCEFYNKDYCIPCKSPDKYYECKMVKIGNQIKIDKWKPSITIEILKEKVKLIRKEFPEIKDWQAKFMEIGSKAMLKNNYSNIVIYNIFKDLTEIFNPKNVGITEDKLVNFMGESSLSFLNDCFNIMLNEN